MKDLDLSENDITKALKPGFSNQEIDDAFNQASQTDDNILDQLDQFESNKEQSSEISNDLLEEAPTPEIGESEIDNYETSKSQVYNMPMQEFSSSQVQEVVEAVVEEKWEDLISRVGDINLWKESINNDLESVKQEILRMQERFNNLQNILIGKVADYNKSVIDINAEMKALEQVIQKIIEPLTTNVKELNKITNELKKKK
jgi:hypothetical protein